jgi:signal transduction histidine kinase
MPVAFAHRASLQQALSNLLSNALKFVAPGVEPRVLLRSERKDSTVRLWVEDNGIGIAPEHRERIFGLFERLHPDKTASPGTGIGLAIVRRAMERMEGSVGIEGAPGQGSRFYLELPLAEPDRAHSRRHPGARAKE